jgi:aspartate aminotransferase-like enzyme
MINKTRLFTPGPTPLLPAAQFAMAAADLHHRTPEFRALFLKVLGQLKVFVGTQNDVLLLSSSGTGAMEASVSNLTSPGDPVLVLTAGKFGERWVDLTKTFGCQVDVVEAAYGQTFDLAEVKKALKPEHKVVYMQASETSTGVCHDVKAVAELVKGTGTLLVVDGITGLGTMTFDVDGWGIDILIGGSQKAVMMSPGLAYLSVSEKAWKAMESSKNPRYYFDLRKERKNQGKGETAYTPAVSLVAGLGAALDYIAGQAGGDLEKGRIALIDNAQTNAKATRAGLVALGFTLFAPTSPSAAATAVSVPEGMDSGDVVKALKTRYSLTIANGQGSMKGKIFRVAHLGFFDSLDTIALLGAMENIAKDTLKLPVVYGQAVAAAQQVYAEAAK